MIRSVAVRRRALLMTSACVFAFASPAFAQSSGAPLEFTITANRGETPVARAGSSVTVISGEDVRKANPVTVLDALRGVPGLSVAQTGGPANLATVFLRGAEARHTLVLIDGVRVGDPSSTGGEFDFANLVATDIERIEVLRGPQSALYGSDAIGGVINIVTRKGRGDPRASIQIEGGSYGTLSTRMAVSGGTQQFSYALALLAARSSGFSTYGYRIPNLEAQFGPLEKDGFTRFAGAARFAWRPTDDLEIEAGLYGGHVRGGYDAAFGMFPDTPSIQKQRLLTAYIRATLDTLGGALRHRVTFYANETDRRLDDTQFNDFGFGRFTTRDLFTFRGQRVGAEYQGDLALGSYGKLTFGGGVERESVKTSTVADPLGFNTTESASYGRTGASLFALYQQTFFDRLDISLGGRLDHVEGVRTFLTGRATAAYRIEETGTKLRASVGTGAKAPSLYQQFSIYAPTRSGYAALVPESSFGVDAGIDQTFAGGRVVLSGTVFHNRIRNLIDFDGSLPSNTPFGFGAYVNVARARISGVELSGDVIAVPDVLRFKGSYTFLDAKNEQTGRFLARRPQHQGKASLVWTPVEKLTIEPSVFFVGERFSGNNETNRLKPFARLDGRIEYQATPNIAVYVRGENLTNTRYEEVKNYGTPGRSVYAGVRATW